MIGIKGVLIGDKNMSIQSVAALRALLAEMEHDVGIFDLSQHQKDILYAAQLLSQNQSSVSAKSLQEHALTKDLPRATFFRNLSALVDLGYLSHCGTKFAGYKMGSSVP